ncbi:MAG: phosphate transport system permease protein [Thermodesulfobacteriota bacterium]|nr:phosphate transport system permease protein [Thermodesulfobacteriota bacterium]
MPESLGPKKTRPWVLIADQLADKMITIGGTFVIGAVLAMMVFLVYEVIPLFRGGYVESHASYKLENQPHEIKSLFTDDYNTIALVLDRKGSATAWHLGTGKQVSVPAFDFKGKEVTAFSKALDGIHIAAGFSDGTVQFGKITFVVEILPEESFPAGLTRLDDRDSTDGRAIYSRIPGKQVRRIQPELQLEDEIAVSAEHSPIRAMDYRFGEFGERPVKTLVTVDNNGSVDLLIVTSRLNLFTRKLTSDVTKIALPKVPAGADIEYVVLNERADTVILAERSGRAFRISVQDQDNPIMAEEVKLTDPDVFLTSLGYLLGDKSLVVAASDGSVKVFYLVSGDDSSAVPSADGKTLKLAKVFPPQDSKITTFVPSKQTKAFVTADSQGGINLRHGSSEKTLLQTRATAAGQGALSIALSTRLDGILAVSSDGTTDFWKLHVPHPETSLKTLFGKIWYEGYPEPSYTWQSTGATDAFEPKLSLVPLIFGTLKATFYSLLFAIPLALFGAVYTSEFLPGEVRGKVKPVMEVMASLPSVVLGFVAALVLAPVVENWIAAVVLAFVVTPLSLIIGAYLWQLLPPQMALRLDGRPKFLAMFFMVGLGFYTAYLVGPTFESVFFGGNLRVWLNSTGDATPILFLLNIPLVAGIVAYVVTRFHGYEYSNYLKGLAMPYSGLIDFARWAALAVLVCIIAYGIAAFMNAIGLDPRGSFIGTYVQRNTLIIGFAMGFAVVPIIYTLAEDALNSVPEHLRSASLGCGATPWQTAMWIVIPTAISGIFSATMIGMGRAVGETMIVVMATGNTPIIDLNIFSGLRALSANIAVELPEAPKDGTLYRVLFLTGLVLFGMTFIINTVAELVRLRFRKKAMEL